VQRSGSGERGLRADEERGEPAERVARQLLPLQLVHVLPQMRRAERWMRRRDPPRRDEHVIDNRCALDGGTDGRERGCCWSSGERELGGRAQHTGSEEEEENVPRHRCNLGKVDAEENGR
jgi:hypothetical protein